MDGNQQNQGVRQSDPFSRMMFGGEWGGGELKKGTGGPIPTKEPQPGGVPINYIQLMEIIDGMVGLADQLKPVFSEVYPFIQQFWKKK
ncbi:hypothetical protein DRW41_17680 [Neobacillus piezotolerans]|uniref:Uncharacterized protein n=1 Tax=Neobacillus piezotolerans TaxID=2259171 RepID=A0A3D8GNC3_9BACI|nr:hypothetical protein [Neobacillus piezotolerans]RDU35566.1 hypothetical protein DRW41_17680 [Neobacillus piezotolerans]